MFNTDPFETINTYCRNRQISPVFRKLLYAKFVEEYTDCRKQNANLTQAQEDTLIKTLLHDNAIERNLNIVKSEVENVVNERIKLKEKMYKIKNVGGTIFVNIVSSFIFTALLILIFAVAESEIKPKIQQFIQSTPIEKIDKE